MSARPARRFVVPVLFAVLVPLLGSVPIAAPAAAKVQVATYVVQGVPGVEVDVLVDGETAESDVAATDVVGPLDLSPGDHTLAFRSDEWEVSTSVDVTGSQDVVLHWPADPADEPVVTVFENDVSPVGSGKGRLTVAHTAVVPPADILAGGETLFTNIASGEFVSVVVPASTYDVAVVPTGGGDPLLGPVSLPLEAGALTRVFAIGTPRNSSMDAVVQVLAVPTTGGQPDEMATGSAGLVRPDGSVDTARQAFWALVSALFGA